MCLVLDLRAGSTSNAWFQGNYADQAGGKAHVGFETANAIRGVYIAYGDAVILYKGSYFPATHDVYGEATWCYGIFEYGGGTAPCADPPANGATYEWFRVNT